MSASPIITVTAIIPTFNRAPMLPECIDSLLAQTRPIQQIIVVNDGSIDNTEAVVKSYGSRITLISQANAGKAAALNAALKQSTSDYIWICDDDDYAAPNGLEQLIDSLSQDPTIDLVFGNYQAFRDTSTERQFLPPPSLFDKMEPNYQIRFLQKMFTYQFAMLVRTSLYKAVGPFNEEFLRTQDYEMTLRLIRQAKIKAVDQIIFYQRYHDGLRGTLSNPISDATRARKPYLYEEKIFSKIYKNYALEEFIPSFAKNWDEPLKHRATLLQRGQIMAKHAMWDAALANFMQAARQNQPPITSEEIHLAVTAVDYSVPWQILGEQPQIIQKIRALYSATIYGHTIVSNLVRLLPWFVKDAIRKKNIKTAVQMISLLFKILGPYGAISMIIISINSKLAHLLPRSFSEPPSSMKLNS